MSPNIDSQVLADWYREETEHEIRKTVPKAIEYGAGDLAEIGRAMGRIMGRDRLDEQEAVEIGIFFYITGKVARWEQAIKDGRRTSDDTIFDIRVYSGMARRNRQVGGWPWANEGANESAEVVADNKPQCGALALLPGTTRITRCVNSQDHAGHHADSMQPGAYAWIENPREGF